MQRPQVLSLIHFDNLYTCVIIPQNKVSYHCRKIFYTPFMSILLNPQRYPFLISHTIGQFCLVFYSPRMESYSTQVFMPALVDFACFSDSPMSLQYFILILLLNSTQLYKLTTFADPFFCQDICVVSHFLSCEYAAGNILFYKVLCDHVFSFLLDKYLGVELLNHRLDTCLAFTKQLSKCLHHFTLIPVVCENQLLCILIHIWCYRSLLYLAILVILICISHMENGGKHLFV